jgi:hypothetical protein
MRKKPWDEPMQQAVDEVQVVIKAAFCEANLGCTAGVIRKGYTSDA